MSDLYDRLTFTLRKLRLKRGMTQEAFAEHSGFAHKYYQAIEAGRKGNMQLPTLEKLAEGHSLAAWELLYMAEASEKTTDEEAAVYGKPKHGRPRKRG